MSTNAAVDVTQRVYRTTNPTTGEILHEWAQMSDDESSGLLRSAHDAFLEWRHVPVADRVTKFTHMADLIDSHTDALARQVTTEMGKPLAHSVAETGRAASIFRYYAEHGEALLADEALDVPGFARGVLRREPMGVVVGIAPWNGPMYQAMRVAAPNLMLGNSVILKPAEITAGSTLMLDELFAEAGFPSGVYQTGLLTTDQISALIADQRVRAVTLTGSDRAGSAVGEQAGHHIKPVVLELGGSDAFIVLDSADPAAAARLAAESRMWVGGQVCVSPKRVIVTDKNADRFIEEYAVHFNKQTLGDPLSPETTVGPLSSQEAADQLQGQLQDAIDKGATVVVPGGRVDGPGSFFAPAVITDLTPEMRLYTEEAFGPVGIVYRVTDADEAVSLANSSKYGLGGTVMGSTTEAEEVARRLDTGSVGINAWLGAPIEIPFGGTKASGFGRELGRSGMDQFANLKVYGIA
jgi:succinate-semialdehyde dehydrogenase/glutarate-semialdehyde dehydrogenase